MVEKLKNLLNKINITLIVVLAYSIKILTSPPEVSHALILLVMGLIYSANAYIKLKTPKKTTDKTKIEVDRLSKDVAEIKGALSKVNMGKINQGNKKYF